MTKLISSDLVSVTDHITNFSIEENILGDFFHNKVSDKTTILLVWHKVIDEDFLNFHPSVRAIVRYGVGYDNIDLDSCKKRNITVANTPDYGIDEVSDSAIAMILTLTRKIGALESLALSDPNYWLGKEIKLKMKRLNTLSLGIIGLGRIGGSIAKKFLPFSKNIGFYDPYLSNGYEKVYGIKRFNNLDNLLIESDIISINTPLNDETRGMVNEDFLNKMKQGSYLVNLSRGPIVKDKGIILKNLISNQLEGYATDVWTEEPPLQNDNLYKAWKENRHNIRTKIIVNPHTSYFSSEALEESRIKACSTCLDIINNRPINNRII
tara:strand:- start:117 stop:1085 length:969 start_codon:yes stop_codon:yes gene_type:complete